MIDEPRDDRPTDDEQPDGEEPQAPGDSEESEAPPPATWAGRRRAGEESSGITEEFDGLEAELSAEFEDMGADEREEPPDEFEFEQEDGPEAEPEDGPEAEPEDGPEAEQEEAGTTVEADTLALVDAEAEREAAQAAAHAGLKARAEKSATVRTGQTPKPVKPPAAAPPTTLPATDVGPPPKRTMWWRFLAASFVIVASMATATAVSFLLYLTDIGDALGDEKFSDSVEPSLSEVEGGQPQTILILGSDKRTTAPGDPGRSDTTMLLRVDPEKDFLALLSLPRDLYVEIPGYGTDRLNAAYSLGEQFEADTGGGPQLTLRTVKNLLGIDIHHIVNVDFAGFYDAINAIGCVYVDVDRHYYNPVGGEYDDIDIEAGYTKLCGYRALDYVRYRHTDNDLVRGARQQAFVREARQQIPPRNLLPPPFGDAELIDIFTKHTTSDINDPPTIVDMLKSFVDVRSAPVRQVSLGELTVEGGVDATNEQIEVAVDQFLGNDLDEEPATPEPSAAPKRKKTKPDGDSEGPALVDVTATSQPMAAEFAKAIERRKGRLPVFYPTKIVANDNTTITQESRAGGVLAPDDKTLFPMYKFVISYQESYGPNYYGVSGVEWQDPPILNNPSETREIDGREYLLFYEGERLRLVGWRTDRGSYWVSNTLTRALSEDEMIAVAVSTRELGN